MSGTADHDIYILKTALDLVAKHFDELVSECLDAEGKPKAPSAGVIAKMRAYLPPGCKNAYTPKKLETQPKRQDNVGTT